VVRLLEETVDQSEVRRTGAGTPNPALVPIVEALIERVDSGKYTAIEVADKKEAERTGESVRNQLKARGFRVSKATQIRTTPLRSPKGRVLRDASGDELTETKVVLLMHASSPLKEPVTEEVNERTNGNGKVRSAKNKNTKENSRETS
jgi:hypothetical protein